MENTSIAESIAQLKPNRICQCSQFRDAETVKCRDPRCSLSCYRNWSHKNGSILAHFLEQLDERFTRFRGNLSFMDSATTKDVRATKERFLYELRKWKKRKANRGVEFELRAVVHCTGPSQLHYDFVAYADGFVSTARLKSDVRAMWSKAGGRTMAFTEQDPDRQTGQARYVYKSVSRVRFRRKRIYLLNTNTIRMAWNTGKFFRGATLNQLWREVRISWFGEESVLEWEAKRAERRERHHNRQCQINALAGAKAVGESCNSPEDELSKVEPPLSQSRRIRRLNCRSKVTQSGRAAATLPNHQDSFTSLIGRVLTFFLLVSGINNASRSSPVPEQRRGNRRSRGPPTASGTAHPLTLEMKHKKPLRMHTDSPANSIRPARYVSWLAYL